MELLEKYRAIDESIRIAQGLIIEAKEELTVFADSPQRASLSQLAEYALERER
jgi:geranylgeranyl pyrophosphate synthase